MKKRTKITLIIIIAFVLIGLITTIICISTSKKNKNTVNVAFYGLEEKNISILKKNLETIVNEKGQPYTYNYFELSSSQALLPQLKRKFDVVYTYMGKNAEQAVSYVKPKKVDSVKLSEDILQDSTISVKQKSIRDKDGNYLAVPLLMDFYEIDIDREILSDAGVTKIANWVDIETFATKTHSMGQAYSILFDANDPSEFLGTIGALTEALSGVNAYNLAVKELSEVAYPKGSKQLNLTSHDYEIAVRKLADEKGSPLFEATHLLSRWKGSNLISEQGFNMGKKDLVNIANMSEAPVLFETFSMRRKIGHRRSQYMSLIYYPSEIRADKRFFTAPVIAAVPLSGKISVKQGIELLLSDEVQGNLADDTGLIPVAANCHVPDRQADDIRYWIAATNSPLTPLGEAVFCDRTGMKLLSDVLINYISDIN